MYQRPARMAAGPYALPIRRRPVVVPTQPVEVTSRANPIVSNAIVVPPPVVPAVSSNVVVRVPMPYKEGASN
jgi:hypothetical protein